MRIPLRTIQGSDAIVRYPEALIVSNFIDTRFVGRIPTGLLGRIRKMKANTVKTRTYSLLN